MKQSASEVTEAHIQRVREILDGFTGELTARAALAAFRPTPAPGNPVEQGE